MTRPPGTFKYITRRKKKYKRHRFCHRPNSLLYLSIPFFGSSDYFSNKSESVDHIFFPLGQRNIGSAFSVTNSFTIFSSPPLSTLF